VYLVGLDGLNEPCIRLGSWIPRGEGAVLGNMSRPIKEDIVNGMVCTKTAFSCVCPIFLQPVTGPSLLMVPADGILHMFVCIYCLGKIRDFIVVIFSDLSCSSRILERFCSQNYPDKRRHSSEN